MNKKILVTGASGFAGKSLSTYLTKKKFKLTKVIFRNLNKKGKIKIDLTKKINLKNNFDWIVHAAAHHKIQDFKKNSKNKAKKNILMVKNLIDFSKKKKIKNFIFFSTIDINYSNYPIEKNIYIKSKVFCEKLLISSLKKKIFDKLIILRLPAIVGKNSNENFIKKTILNMKHDKPINIWNKSVKFNNLIHINDLNNLILHSISKKSNKKKILIDCLSSQSIKLMQLMFFLKKKLNSRSKINFVNGTKFKKIENNFIKNYKFFTVKKAVSLLI